MQVDDEFLRNQEKQILRTKTGYRHYADPSQINYSRKGGERKVQTTSGYHFTEEDDEQIVSVLLERIKADERITLSNHFSAMKAEGLLDMDGNKCSYFRFKLLHAMARKRYKPKREIAMELFADGHSVDEVVEKTGLSKKWVADLQTRYRKQLRQGCYLRSTKPHL